MINEEKKIFKNIKLNYDFQFGKISELKFGYDDYNMDMLIKDLSGIHL